MQNMRSWMADGKELREVTECLLDFIKRVSSGKNTTPEETAILPAIVKEVYVGFPEMNAD